MFSDIIKTGKLPAAPGMKNPFLSSWATATVATPATPWHKKAGGVATVATVAVANNQIVSDFLNRKAITVFDLRHYFRFDLVQNEIDELGYSKALLSRINNMTFELMDGDDMNFEEAIQLAASIVFNLPFAPCELRYVNIASQLAIDGE